MPMPLVIFQLKWDVFMSKAQFAWTVVLPIFVKSTIFCQAVHPILPGSLTNFEIGIFISLHLTLCNVMSVSQMFTIIRRQPGKICRTAKIRPILAVLCKRLLMKHQSFNKIAIIGLYHPLDGITNPKYTLLNFLKTKFFCKVKEALAFDWDRCCHWALCLWLILFHWHCIKYPTDTKPWIPYHDDTMTIMVSYYQWYSRYWP